MVLDGCWLAAGAELKRLRRNEDKKKDKRGEKTPTALPGTPGRSVKKDLLKPKHHKKRDGGTGIEEEDIDDELSKVQEDASNAALQQSLGASQH